MNRNPRRSWLIVPASKPAQIDEASRSGADAVVLDLVELVADNDKAAARQALKASIERLRERVQVFVQIEASSADAELSAAVWPGLAGVLLSRVETPQQVTGVASALERLERERGFADGAIEIVAALETAKGNHAAYEILSASPRVTGATLGRADLVMDLRPEPSGEIHLMPYLMQRLVIVAGAAGVAPIGAWWRAPDRGLLATPENTHEAAKRGRAIGFKGAMCLRANQVDALNRGYANLVRPARSVGRVEGRTE